MSLISLSDLNSRVCQYLLNTSFAPYNMHDYSQFWMMSDGTNVQIQYWAYNVRIPEYDDLVDIDFSQYLGLLAETAERSKIMNIARLSDASLLEMKQNGETQDGMFCFAKDRQVFTIYYEDNWNIVNAYPSTPQQIISDSTL
jgi:hypothetical protein